MTKHDINSVKRIEGYEGYQNLYCIDQSLKKLNPTGTFKDKQFQALELRLYKDTHPPLTMAAMSTGNTAYSLLSFSRNYNRFSGNQITPVVFIPQGLEKRAYFGPDTDGNIVSGRDYFKVLKSMAKQANGEIIPLNFASGGFCSEDLAKIAHQHGLIDKKGSFIDITEGLENARFLKIKDILSPSNPKKRCKLGIKAYRPIIERAVMDLTAYFDTSPDYVICQFGAGILFNEVRDFLANYPHSSKIIPVAVGDPESCAEKIYPSYWAEEPSSLRLGGKTKSKHDGTTVYGVEDWEIGKALQYFKGKLNAEPAGLAGLAILHRLEDIVPELDRKNHDVVVINTGNGIPNFLQELGKKRKYA